MPNPKPLTDEVLEAAEFAGDRAEDAISEQLLNEKKVGGLPSPIHAATEAAAPLIAQAERERIRERIEQVVEGHVGKPLRPAPNGLDEWGPDCAGCGDKEFRIDGYCSIECRNAHDFAADILAALNPDKGE